MDKAKKEILKHVKEDQVHNAVMAWLRVHGFHIHDNPSRAQYSVKGQKFKKFDGTYGTPDIILVVNGFYIGLELKRPVRGVQSDDQKEYQTYLEQTGGGYYQLVTSTDDIEWLHEFRRKTFDFHGYVGGIREKLILKKYK